MNDWEYAQLRERIHQLLKVDIGLYRQRQMRRRIEAFVSRRAGGDVKSFVKGLEGQELLLKELHDMLTINVSEFFRDPSQFRHLKAHVLPELLKKSSRPRIWSAACSHGAEPYSIAIILDELGHSTGYSIVATDIDEGILKRAIAGGPYRGDETRNVSDAELGRFFKPSGDGYRIREDFRSRVQFRKHDLLAGESLGVFDLIVCRNAIMYFSSDARHHVVERLHESLKPGGVLFLGGTEALLDGAAAGFSRLSGSFYVRDDGRRSSAYQRQAA